MQVELKTSPDTPDTGSLQKAADFVQAFILGVALASLQVCSTQAISTQAINAVCDSDNLCRV